MRSDTMVRGRWVINWEEMGDVEEDVDESVEGCDGRVSERRKQHGVQTTCAVELVLAGIAAKDELIAREACLPPAVSVGRSQVMQRRRI